MNYCSVIHPYSFRIMAALPGHAPVELFRSAAPYSQQAWNFHTRDIAPEWTCWTEHRMRDKDCITPRIKRATRAERIATPLTREEKQELRDQPDYAFNP